MRRVDRYAIEAELDSGGFGTVYRARHQVIGRSVALKLLHPSRESSLDVIERFLREARILSAIASPHVVQVIDAGMTEERQLFLAMELLEGESLAKRIARAGPLGAREAISIARQILAGLAAAHAVGVVHRDLKPANVFLARTPDHREIAKVLDFGISKSRGPAGESVITMTGAVLGTPHYMAPEQLHGAREVDARADLYALAVCLYEMLSRKLPYQPSGGLESLIALRLTEPPTPLARHQPHLPRALLDVVDRGLARDPDARFRSAAEMDAALAAIEPGAALPATASPAPSTPPLGGHGARPASASGAKRAPAAVPASAVMMASPIAAHARPVAPAPTPQPGARSGPRAAAAALVVVLAGAIVLVILLATALVAGIAALALGPAASSPALPSAPAPASPPPAAPTPIPVPGTVPGPVPVPVPDPDPLPGPHPDALPVADPDPGRAPRAAPTRAWVDSVLGSADGASVERALARAAPAIERCRRPRVDDDVVLQVFVNPDGALPIVQPDVNRPHGDDDTARCVARAIRDQSPIDARGGSGIVTVLAHLAAR